MIDVLVVKTIPVTLDPEMRGGLHEDEFQIGLVNTNSIISIRPYDLDNKYCVFNCGGERLIVLGSSEKNISSLVHVGSNDTEDNIQRGTT